MKLSTIVANALEICDTIRAETVGINDPNVARLWQWRQEKIRNWYLRRLIRGVSCGN